MGWSSANQIFDPVAQALIDLRAPDDLKIRVLEPLIRGLQECDWDTEDESLEDFKHDAGVVEAFRRCDVRFYCDPDQEHCVLDVGHLPPHKDCNGREWG